MLNQRKILPIQHNFLPKMPRIKGHFLGVFDESRVREPELALKFTFGGEVVAKGRGEGAHDVCCELDEESHYEEAFPADVAGEFPVVDDHVENWFGEVAV
jgi:hypothetical protein